MPSKLHNIEVKAIRSVDELQQLSKDYENFLNSCPGDTYYLRTGWIDSMIDVWALDRNNGHGSRTLFLLLAFCGGEIIGAMPLQLHEKSKGPLVLNRLHGLGVIPGHSLSSPIFENKAVNSDHISACFESFQSYLLRMKTGIWDVLELDLIPKPSSTIRVLDQRWSSLIRSPTDMNGVGFEIPKGQIFEKLRYGTGKFRGDLRRRHRLLIADHGDYEVLIDSEITSDDWEQIGQLHTKRQDFKRNRGVSRYSLFDDPLGKSSMLRAMRFAEQEKMAIYYRLKIKGQLAAFKICLKDRDTLYIFLIGFDPEFDRYSPSKQLMVALLEDACHSGVTYIDWLPGESHMKRNFSNRLIQYERRLFVHPSWQAHIRYRIWSWCRDLSRLVLRKVA